MSEPLPAIESAAITPSIGDDVLFQLNGLTLASPRLTIINPALPVHAKVVYVWDPFMVNLVVWDHYGNMHTLTSVKFLPPGEDVPVGQTYCELAFISGELIEGAFTVDALHESDLVDTTEQAATARSQTYGQKAVGISFNPGGDPAVTDCKASVADLIDTLNIRRSSSADPEVKLLCSIAVTEMQTAQMWAVKALTWQG